MNESSYLTWFRRLALAAAALAFVVIVLGAWVRLSAAGLGCPDWPGCYGHLTVDQAARNLDAISQSFPERPFEYHKALKEMVHRYFASTLGLAILILAGMAIANRKDPRQPLATFALLAWLAMKPRPIQADAAAHSDRPLATFAAVGLAVLVAQIALGGWTSSNYAALACPDFPTCQNEWWPDMDAQEAFVLWRGLGIDYEGGVLDHPARVAIHFTHRLGAIAAALVLGALSLMAWRRSGALRTAGAALGLVLIIQLVLGPIMVMRALPLSLATAHNGVAALLLLAALRLNYAARRAQ